MLSALLISLAAQERKRKRDNGESVYLLELCTMFSFVIFFAVLYWSL